MEAKKTKDQMLLVAVCLLHVSFAHRPLLEKPSCRTDFSTPEQALHVPDISISWAFQHGATCDARAVWNSFDYHDKEIGVYFGIGVPVSPRFEDLRVDALLVGPGLPDLSLQERTHIPEEILQGIQWCVTVLKSEIVASQEISLASKKPCKIFWLG